VLVAASPVRVNDQRSGRRPGPLGRPRRTRGTVPKGLARVPRRRWTSGVGGAAGTFPGSSRQVPRACRRGRGAARRRPGGRTGEDRRGQINHMAVRRDQARGRSAGAGCPSRHPAAIRRSPYRGLRHFRPDGATGQSGRSGFGGAWRIRARGSQTPEVPRRPRVRCPAPPGRPDPGMLPAGLLRALSTRRRAPRRIRGLPAPLPRPSGPSAGPPAARRNAEAPGRRPGASEELALGCGPT
jgi:hypothetical protein